MYYSLNLDNSIVDIGESIVFAYNSPVKIKCSIMDMKGYKIKQITDASPAHFPANYGRVHVFFEKLQYVQQKPDKQIKVHVHVHDTCI